MKKIFLLIVLAIFLISLVSLSEAALWSFKKSQAKKSQQAASAKEESTTQAGGIKISVEEKTGQIKVEPIEDEEDTELPPIPVLPQPIMRPYNPAVNTVSPPPKPMNLPEIPSRVNLPAVPLKIEAPPVIPRLERPPVPPQIPQRPVVPSVAAGKGAASKKSTEKNAEKK